LDSGGLIISEYPPGTGTKKWHFPARNRIISGLARGTVIVEAPEKSGALITAGFALEQGRDLWVDGACIVSGRSAGTARLADDGAGLISSAADILAEWTIVIKKEAVKSKANHSPGNVGSGLASSMAEYLNLKQ
jgi:DNA processing protein